MKRYGNLWSQILDIENIKLAHNNARKGKTHYKEVLKIDNDLEYYSLKIQDMLITKKYTVSEYTTFGKVDKGKLRELYKLPYFPDRIIQHAIMQILEPIWKPYLITDTYQAIRCRGVFKCLKKIKRNVQREGNNYCLQIDINKFYPSIDNDILKGKLRKKIKCKDTLWLLDCIVDSCEGVPIGNYISQYFGNLFLADIDRKMKEKLKVKNYYRYCDDIVVLSKDKTELHEVLKFFNRELTKINLKLKPNYQVYKITKDRGVDFLGIVTYPKSTRLRKNIVKSFKKLTNTCDTRSAKSILSYYGWIKHSRAYSLWNKQITKYINRLRFKYGYKVTTPEIESIKRLTHGY